MNDDLFNKLRDDDLLCFCDNTQSLVRVGIEVEPDIATGEAHLGARLFLMYQSAYWEGSNLRTFPVSWAKRAAWRGGTHSPHLDTAA